MKKIFYIDEQLRMMLEQLGFQQIPNDTESRRALFRAAIGYGP
jgi:hypothetical protein